MSVNNRFHLFVASLTLAGGLWISGHFPPTLTIWTQLGPAGKFAGRFIGSAAFYQGIAWLLRWVFDHLLFLRKLVFGKEFLEGTWIGSFGTGADRRFTIENFEQTIEGIAVRGYAYTDTDVLYAQWISKSVTFDVPAGTVSYSYGCDLLASKSSHQGIAFFNVQRVNANKPPHGMIGFSADLIDGVKASNTETKLSDEQVESAIALKAAKRLP
jgi:hypothetical protein